MFTKVNTKRTPGVKTTTTVPSLLTTRTTEGECSNSYGDGRVPDDRWVPCERVGRSYPVTPHRGVRSPSSNLHLLTLPRVLLPWSEFRLSGPGQDQKDEYRRRRTRPVNGRDSESKDRTCTQFIGGSDRYRRVLVSSPDTRRTGPAPTTSLGLPLPRCNHATCPARDPSHLRVRPPAPPGSSRRSFRG